MNKILIKEDLRKFTNIKSTLNFKCIKLLTELKDAYDQFEMAQFSNEVLQDCYNNNGSNTILEFKQFVTKRMANIPAVFMKENEILTQNLINKFQSAVNDVNMSVYTLTTAVDSRFYTYDPAKGFYIDDKAEERIKEMYCRYYITDETNKMFYDYLIGVQKAIKKGEELFRDSKNSTGFSLQSVPQFLAQFFDEDLNINERVCFATKKLN